MLFSSQSRDISCSMCLLTGGVNSPPTGFHSYLRGQRSRAYRPSPHPISLAVLHNILSCQSIFSPFFHASDHPKWEYAFNDCAPLPRSPGPFSPSQTQPLLTLHVSLPLPLVHPFMSLNVHFICTLFDGFKQPSQIQYQLGKVNRFVFT